MPKIKSHKSAVKRLTVTGSGKIKLHHANRGHRKRFKSSRAKQHSTQDQVIGGAIAKKLKGVL